MSPLRLPSSVYTNVSEAVWRDTVIALVQTFRWRVLCTRQSAVPGLAGRMVSVVIGDSKGYPDLTLFRDDETLYVELKGESGTLRPEQVEWRAFLEASGRRYYLWRPSQIDTIVEILRGGQR